MGQSWANIDGQSAPLGLQYGTRSRLPPLAVANASTSRSCSRVHQVGQLSSKTCHRLVTCHHTMRARLPERRTPNLACLSWTPGRGDRLASDLGKQSLLVRARVGAPRERSTSSGQHHSVETPANIQLLQHRRATTRRPSLQANVRLPANMKRRMTHLGLERCPRRRRLRATSVVVSLRRRRDPFLPLQNLTTV